MSPMVICGTHALDVVMRLMDGKTPVEVYARSIDRVLGPSHQGIDATGGLITMSDGALYHLNISWALPVVWPGASERSGAGPEQPCRYMVRARSRTSGASAPPPPGSAAGLVSLAPASGPTADARDHSAAFAFIRATRPG